MRGGGWFGKNWRGCALCYLAGLSWSYTDGIGLGWQFLIALVIFMVGERVAEGG